MDQAVRSDPVSRARALGPLIAENADAIERTQRIPSSLLQEINRAQLFRLLLPRGFGGEETHPRAYFEAVEEVSRHDGSLGWVMFVANSAALIAAHMEPATARTIFADPAGSLAWGPPGAQRAQAVPGGYRVSGTWPFASGCRHATWMGAHCPVIEAEGGLRLNAAGRPALRTLLFPVSSATLHDDWDVIGLRGTSSVSYSVRDLFVPEAHTSTRDDPAGSREMGRLYAFPQQTLYPVGAAAVAAGLTRGMLEAFGALAQRKAPRNLGTLAADIWVQTEFARQEARLASARALVLSVLEEVWTDPERGVVALHHRARLRMATTHALAEAVQVAGWAWHAAGTDAIRTGSPFERRFRDLLTVSQQIQARTANFEAVGKVLLGQELGGAFY